MNTIIQQPLFIFTTVGCHLCEEAQGMLGYYLRQNRDAASVIDVQLIDIANDDDLIEQYGVRIPVFKLSEHELNWPFDYDVLEDWLKKRLNSNI